MMFELKWLTPIIRYDAERLVKNRYVREGGFRSFSLEQCRNTPRNWNFEKQRSRSVWIGFSKIRFHEIELVFA